MKAIFWCRNINIPHICTHIWFRAKVYDYFVARALQENCEQEWQTMPKFYTFHVIIKCSSQIHFIWELTRTKSNSQNGSNKNRCNLFFPIFIDQRVVWNDSFLLRRFYTRNVSILFLAFQKYAFILTVSCALWRRTKKKQRINSIITACRPTSVYI